MGNHSPDFSPLVTNEKVLKKKFQEKLRRRRGGQREWGGATRCQEELRSGDLSPRRNFRKAKKEGTEKGQGTLEGSKSGYRAPRAVP